MDSKIVQVALNGLENILRLGEQEANQSGTGINPYCSLIEEAYGRLWLVASVLLTLTPQGVLKGVCWFCWLLFCCARGFSIFQTSQYLFQ